MTPATKSTLYAIGFYLVFIPLTWIACQFLAGGPCTTTEILVLIPTMVLAFFTLMIFIACLIGRLRGNHRYKGPLIIHGFFLLSYVLLYLAVSKQA